jgi:hypothetical protein
MKIEISPDEAQALCGLIFEYLTQGGVGFDDEALARVLEKILEETEE